MTEAALFTTRRTTRSPAATVTLGARLGRLLQPGDVVAFVGDLGAGKTQLIRGACRGARVPPQEVASPSFAIVASYHGRIPIHHADLYRIGDEDELYATGFFDLVGGDGALLVEWADRVPGALPEERLEIRMAHHPRLLSVRRLEIAGAGERHSALARALARGGRPGAKPRKRSGARSGNSSGSRVRTTVKAARVGAQRARGRPVRRRGARRGRATPRASPPAR
jgi:tRNA threonylcarbamoyladenosine biosynthesis protein TsaE